MPADIVLIGPMGVGKTTVSKLLAQTLGQPRRSVDDYRYDYFREIGYDQRVAGELKRRRGFAAQYQYWKRFEAHAAVRVLATYRDCVIDFGAGNSVYEDEKMFARVELALRPYPNVVLLLPCQDPDRSIQILDGRREAIVMNDGRSLNAHLIQSPCNRTLARHVIYTEGQTPENVRDHILEIYSANRDKAPAVSGQ